jgi:penicillin-binding protein-related factor A (putative recombinase)
MNNGYMWMIECKETNEGTINFSKIPQLDRKDGLKDYIGLKDVQPYIIVWFRKFDKIIAVPAAEALRIKNDGNKSISLKMLEDKSYYIIELPSVKLRTFLSTDYTYLLSEDILNECKTRNCFK